MSVPAEQLPASLPLQEPSCVPLLTLDTTSGSWLHHAWSSARRRAAIQPLPLALVYLVAVAATALPLLVAALLGPLSLTAVTATQRLPLLYDWNVAFMFLVSFPSLVVLTANDEHVLSEALHAVEIDGTLTIAPEHANLICIVWQRRFSAANRVAQLLGIAVGGAVAYFNYRTYVPASVGYWIAAHDQLLPAGYMYLYAVFLFYFFVVVFVVRSAAIALLLRDIAGRSRLRMLPLHPDKCGGLRPMGRIGLRNQYLLTIFGLNIAILVAVSFHYLKVPPGLYWLIAAALAGYLVLGPIIFIAPLLSFRAGMLRSKTELLRDVALRLRLELQGLRAQLPSGPITRENEELIDRLRKVGAVIDELPVWPFDAGTLRKFIAAYVVPVVTSVAFELAKDSIDFLKAVPPP